MASCLKVCGYLSLILAVALYGLLTVLRQNNVTKGTFPFLVTQENFSLNQIPDLTGKVIIVTGANAGLGKSTAKFLALNGATTIMGCRSLSRCQQAKDEILTETANAEIPKSRKASKKDVEKNLVPMLLDLNSLSSVKTFGKEFNAKYKRLDSLILNAGIMHPPFTLSEDGLESQFAVNHLGHFYLTKLLLAKLKQTAKDVAKDKQSYVSIVSVSSNGHFAPYGDGKPIKLSVEELNSEAGYHPVLGYGQSKLCNVLFASHLSKLLQDDGQNIAVNSLNPGGVDTELTRHYGPLARKLFKYIGSYMEILFTPDRASLTQLYLSIGLPEQHKARATGKYFVPLGEQVEPSEFAKDESLGTKLWEFSERLLKEKGFTDGSWN